MGTASTFIIPRVTKDQETAAHCNDLQLSASTVIINIIATISKNSTYKISVWSTKNLIHSLCILVSCLKDKELNISQIGWEKKSSQGGFDLLNF